VKLLPSAYFPLVLQSCCCFAQTGEGSEELPSALALASRPLSVCGWVFSVWAAFTGTCCGFVTRRRSACCLTGSCADRLVYCYRDWECVSLIVLQCSWATMCALNPITHCDLLLHPLRKCANFRRERGNNSDLSLPWNAFGRVCICANICTSGHIGVSYSQEQEAGSPFLDWG